MLNARQLQAVDLLSRAVNKKEVAEQVGVNRGTIYNWLEQPEFQHEIEQRRQSLQHMLSDPTPYLTGLLHWKSDHGNGLLDWRSPYTADVVINK